MTINPKGTHADTARMRPRRRRGAGAEAVRGVGAAPRGRVAGSRWAQGGEALMASVKGDTETWASSLATSLIGLKEAVHEC